MSHSGGSRNGARLRKAGERSARMGWRDDDQAAMEPAYERRENHPVAGHLAALAQAAMEPAYERRENPSPAAAPTSCPRPPQWSPPTKGGRTHDGPPEYRPDDQAAMEPAYERRENCPDSAATSPR